ncbi:MAG: hypothetical protein JW908_02845 [Anaerolineales bacterium]|nr:hypothetical protein [Anaerolineales bacterium]
MDKKNTGIIATVATALLCGCPGLFGLCFGLMFAVISQIPGADIDVLGSSDPQTALTTGLGTLCVGIIFIAIPIVVGILTLRKKNNGAAPVTTVEGTATPVETTPTPAEIPSMPTVTPPDTTETPPPDEPLPPAI